MKKSQLIWYTGLWFLPISGTIFAGIMPLLGKYLPSQMYAFLVAIILSIGPIICIYRSNRIAKNRYYREKFDPIAWHKWKKSGRSKEKLDALFTPPEPENLFNAPTGMVLAKTINKYVCVPLKPNNLLMGVIVGSPGSGKSSGPYISSLANNFANPKPTTCYVIDIKGELHEKCVRGDDPRVKVVDPDDPTSAGWDPLYDLTQSSSDDRVIDSLDKIARAIIVEANEKNAFFSNSARKIFKGAVLYFFRKQVWSDEKGNVKSGFAGAIVELQSADTLELIKRILEDKEVCSKHQLIEVMLGSFANSESEAMNGIKLSLAEHLDIFASETVQRMMSDQNHYKASPLDLNNGISIFLSVKEDKLASMQALFRLISYQVLAEMERRPESSDTVLMIYDEFPRLGKIDRITSALATFRSRKVSLWMAIQDFSQLQSVYGHDDARIILNLCETAVLLSCRDSETGKLIEEWSGRYEEKKKSRNQNSISGIKNIIANVSFERRPVVDLSDLMRLRTEKGVAMWIEGRYCRAKRVRWYEERKLKKIVEKNMEHNEKLRHYRKQDQDIFDSEKDEEILFFDDDEPVFDDVFGQERLNGYFKNMNETEED